MKFDFTKNRNVADLGVVPANCQAFYEKSEEDDGRYNLRADAQTTAAIAVITGQNKALKAVRQEVTDVKAAGQADLSSLSAYGATVDEIAAAVSTKIEELTAAASGKESDVASRIAAIKKEHGEAVASLTTSKDKEISTKQEQLESYMLDSSIMHAGAGWNGLNTTLISPFARKQMKVADVDGKPRVVVVGADGEARYSTSPERAGELMNPDELLIEMSEDKSFRQLFPSTQAVEGGGSQQRNIPAGVRRGEATKNMTPAQKIGHGLKTRK